MRGAVKRGFMETAFLEQILLPSEAEVLTTGYQQVLVRCAMISVPCHDTPRQVWHTRTEAPDLKHVVSQESHFMWYCLHICHSQRPGDVPVLEV